MLLGDIIGVKEGCERVWEKEEAGRLVKVKVDVQAVWSGKLLASHRAKRSIYPRV